MELTHGGDVNGYQFRFGRRPLDFSASLSPLGMPPAVRDAVKAAVDDAYAYPDPLCRRLVAALSRHLSVPESWLFCGNGAADILFRLVHAVRPRNALLTAPAFAEYEQALRSADCRIEYQDLSADDGFAVTDDILRRIVSGLDMLFLCQPNNPTGRLVDPGLAKAILEKCAEVGAVLVMDECFCPFLDEPEKHSLLRCVGDYPNLFILDSFTKLYGMAGIRLGHGISSDTALVEKLHRAGQPWAVSTLAQAAGVAALAEAEYVERARRSVMAAKQPLVDGLARLGNEIIGFAANYVFFRSAVPDLGEKLMREGVLIRNCGNFRGLEPGHYRVSVRLEEENALLLRAMETIAGGQP